MTEAAMKIRIGLGLGTQSQTNTAERFGQYVTAAETHGFDSIWLSERISGDAPDPVVAMSYLAGLTSRIKFGTSVMVLPGRNPVLVAKALASLDRLSNGRLLPAFGLGVADPLEQQAFGVTRESRASWFDESLGLIRALWSGEPVTHHGERFHFDGVVVRPTPIQQPIDVWLGGSAPGELRRVGRVGDGWLPSFVTATKAAAGWDLITATAQEHDRSIDDDHFGVLIPYSDTTLPDATAAAIAKRTGGDSVADVVPIGPAALSEAIGRFIDVGASKFVVIPLTEPRDWDEHLGDLAAHVLSRQT
jgi:probable F420-dependent oxidoreductase